MIYIYIYIYLFIYFTLWIQIPSWEVRLWYDDWGGSQYLFKRCLDPQGDTHTYIYIALCFISHQTYLFEEYL